MNYKKMIYKSYNDYLRKMKEERERQFAEEYKDDEYDGEDDDTIVKSKLDYIDEQLLHHFGKKRYLKMFKKYGNRERLVTGQIDDVYCLFLVLDEEKWDRIKNKPNFVLYKD